jgi:Tfp pilus assembly protein PilX
MNIKRIGNERGVALVLALVISLAVMAMVAGMLYFTDQSTRVSGAQKMFATADAAADGAVEAVKDAINLTFWGESPPDNLFTDGAGNDAKAALVAAILNTGGAAGPARLTLPASLGGYYTANVTIERLFTASLPGSRLEFARSAGGAATTAVYFRITVTVAGPRSTAAESSVLYRFAG